MGESPKSAQYFHMIWSRLEARKQLRHGFVSELTDLEKNDLHLQDGKNETVKYKVFASTWNVGGVAPPDDLDLKDLLDTETDYYDIYVLGFQEVVPLNARNVLGPKRRSAATKWHSLIADALNNNRRGRRQEAVARAGRAPQRQWRQEEEKFVCVMSKQMVGIFVSVWARSGLRRHVRHAGVSSVGAGVLGRLGNKGAVSVRFLLHRTSVCFVCCHLASGGGGGAARRNADAAEILSRTSFLQDLHSSGGAPATADLPKKILDHDRVVLLGDLNYRIAMDGGEARQLVGARKWGMLLENDELLLELSAGRQFDGWREGHVTFAPTYKYRPNSDEFHDSTGAGHRRKQHRAPAWCDRILWHGKGMRQARYERCGGYRLSDHRPVRAVFHTVCEVAEGI
ncbi:unnamed protein product [Urochloa decumbens]|uniref:Inositol polyphosphate-related phosphatase domain-containing protein n=1 Tax=Urochloa decumbens TaxID=240449 RepID=A0ABC9BC09_9POAL